MTLVTVVFLTLLLIAGSYDLTQRRVPNGVWLVTLPVAVASSWPIALTTVLAVGQITLLGWYAWTRGLLGGADVKAVIVTTIAFGFFGGVTSLVALGIGGGVSYVRGEAPFVSVLASMLVIARVGGVV